MPVPLPPPGTARLGPPDEVEVRTVVRGLATAAAGPAGLTEVQRCLIEELTESMTGRTVSIAGVEPIGATEFAEALAARNAEFRTRMVQLMVLCGLVLVPADEAVVDRTVEFAHELSVEDRQAQLIRAARRMATGSLGLAMIDFERSGYLERVSESAHTVLHTRAALTDAWQLAPNDPALHARWAALEDCPADSFGAAVWRFYRARGFQFPGAPGAAPPLLAQHDWIHVLADYGSTVESEIEVFGLIARANDDPQAFSLLAMAISLFETGQTFGIGGFFEYDRGHLSGDARNMARRLGDAMYRGAMVATNLNAQRARRSEPGGRLADSELPDHTDLLAVDWFRYATWPLDEAQERFGLPAKGPKAIAAGSVGPFAPGGISPFQYRNGREVAAAEGRDYDAFGAEPPA